MAGVMRIVSLASASALLCLAAATPTATRPPPTAPAFFGFTDSDFTHGNVGFSSVFLASAVHGRSRTFSWTTSSRVDYVQLRNVVPDGGHTPYMQVLAMASSRGATASSSFGLSGGPRYHGTKHSRLRRALDDTQVTLSDFESNPTDGSVTIPDMGVLADQGTLFFVALWEGGGHTFSRNFTVTTLGPANANLLELAAGYQSSAPHPEDQLSDGASLTPPVVPSTTAPSLTSPTAPSDVPEVSPSAPVPPPAPAAHVSGDKGRLAPGIIIAIASGSAMAGLVVLTAMIWFILFRRGPERLSKTTEGNYGHGGMWTRQLAEKNASVETQHSASSNDNLPGRAITTDNHNAVAVAPSNTRPGSSGVQQPHTGDTPPPYLQPQSRDSPTIPRYLDLFNFSRVTAVVGAGPSPTTSITPLAADAAPHATLDTAISSTAQGRGVQQGRYPHLVEDGMTDADILRLEEEERELDAAIERARRR